MVAFLVDAHSLAEATNDQIEKITTRLEHVELLHEGGAVYRWRLVGDEWMWWIKYDRSLIGPNGNPTDDREAAVSRP